MVAGSNLSWQGFKKKAVNAEGAGPVCTCTWQCTLEGSVQGGYRELGVQNFFNWPLKGSGYFAVDGNLPFLFYLPYLSSIHEKANCIAILWTVSLHSLGSCLFRGLWATCLPHEGGASH